MAFSWKGVIFFRPETKWANAEQVEGTLREYWRTEPTSVAIEGDDFVLGVKG